MSKTYSRNPRWWQFLWPRPEFRRVAGELSRFIVGTAAAKFIVFCWAEPDWRPSNSTNMFALDSDYAMGVLSSRIHTEWARGRSSTLEDHPVYAELSVRDVPVARTLRRPGQLDRTCRQRATRPEKCNLRA